MRVSPGSSRKLAIVTGWPTPRTPPGHNRRQLEEALAVAAHEIRGPLTTARLLVELWMRSKNDARSGDRLAGKLVECIEQGGRLIDCLLRASIGPPALSLRPLDLGELCSSVVETMRPVSESHPVHFTPPRAPVAILGDRTRLVEVVHNLLGNAQRHTPAGTRIWVSVGILRGMATLTVEDDGPGIGSEVLPRLFRRFERGSHAARNGGLGLGLYLSAQIARAHGGRITAESRPAAPGARFTVWLPAGSVGAA